MAARKPPSNRKLKTSAHFAAPVDPAVESGTVVLRTPADCKKIGAVLRYLRRSRQVSLETLAQRTGLDLGQLSRIETKATPQPETMVRFLEGIGLQLVIDAVPALGIALRIEPKTEAKRPRKMK